MSRNSDMYEAWKLRKKGTVQKVWIKTLIPLYRRLKTVSTLEPGEYEAEADTAGIIHITHEGRYYRPMPGQYVFLSAPQALLDYFTATVALVKAQVEYEATKEKWQKTFIS
ncbi:hypothetical protein AGMMS50268_09180 [Spirochaetia bacterium]|nr:hypothetical protein AGMMS50268_09180 [Spirochaetia bacterium]